MKRPLIQMAILNVGLALGSMSLASSKNNDELKIGQIVDISFQWVNPLIEVLGVNTYVPLPNCSVEGRVQVVRFDPNGQVLLRALDNAPIPHGWMSSHCEGNPTFFMSVGALKTVKAEAEAEAELRQAIAENGLTQANGLKLHYRVNIESSQWARRYPGDKDHTCKMLNGHVTLDKFLSDKKHVIVTFEGNRGSTRVRLNNTRLNKKNHRFEEAPRKHVDIDVPFEGVTGCITGEQLLLPISVIQDWIQEAKYKVPTQPHQNEKRIQH